MVQVNVHEAKAQLFRLIARAEQGETVVLAQGGRPVARLVPIVAPGTRELGFASYRFSDTFFEVLPEDELRRWEECCVPC